MIRKAFSKLLDVNQKELDRLRKKVEKINSLEEETKKLKEADFAKKTADFKRRLKEGESLEDILPEAFALVREAAVRTLEQRPYDVQLMAGIALFEGKVAEQKTGEGKTLSAAAPLYLRALSGNGAHLVTVNDYLARVGAGWNAPIYDLLGMSVGVIVQEQKSFLYDPKFTDKSHGDERLYHLKSISRKEAYAADITYGTNNEFGFDYLRDNMVQSLDQMVQRGHYFAIIDEVDSILIDEARTPLIISAPDTEPTEKYYKFAEIVGQLTPEEDYTIDEKSKSASLTEDGIAKVENILGLTNLYEEDFEAIHHLENALRARSIYLKDKDYVVKDNEVVIVDEFTGRLMIGRRWSDGLHQAVEAKEGVTIQQESKTLATISFQNYFRMYEHLSGMTGTAATEADEFRKIYDLEVVVVPTHRPMVRDDKQDLIYKTLSGKYRAIAQEVAKAHEKGQPVLVGTTSIEKNEIISDHLKKEKVPHNILNAKNHEREAMIIADAGRPGAVTVATNMAGRGVDIILGGAKPEGKKGLKKWQAEHDQVIKAGGLYVLGTERHESRRIDNQLRGRAGRQGDPGLTRFFLSLEDDLMRVFGGERIGGIMETLKMPEDMPIENKLVSRAIEQAQVKVEGFNFDIRKRLVEYDDVANQQREIVYKRRKKILESESLKEEVLEKLKDKVVPLASLNKEKIVVGLMDVIPFDEKAREEVKAQIGKIKGEEKRTKFLEDLVENVHSSREKQVGEAAMRQIERFAYLGAIDHLWIDHIDHIEGLRESVTLRAYGQRDPLVEFKNEAFGLFERLMGRLDEELAHRVFRIQARVAPEIPLEQAVTNVDTSDMIGLKEPGQKKTQIRKSKTAKKLGRNDPCWCGSGKKWKKCHYPQTG